MGVCGIEYGCMWGVRGAYVRCIWVYVGVNMGKRGAYVRCLWGVFWENMGRISGVYMWGEYGCMWGVYFAHQIAIFGPPDMRF